MSELYEISQDFSELFAQFDDICNYEFDTNADGEPIDGAGNVIENPEGYKAELLRVWYDTVEMVDADFNHKAEQIAIFIKNLKADAEKIEAEEKTLKARKESKNRQIDSLKNLLKGCMEKVGKFKIDMPKAKISIRNNPESLVVDDELGFINWAQQNNDNLLKYSLPDIRKAEVKKLVQQGEVIPNVHLERGESVIIK